MNKVGTIRRIEKMFVPWQKGLVRCEEDIKHKRNPVDIMLLLCCVLDSLSNHFLNAIGTQQNRETFLKFLCNYTPFRQNWNILSLVDFQAFLLWAYNWSEGFLISNLFFDPSQKVLKNFYRNLGQNSNAYQDFLATLLFAIDQNLRSDPNGLVEPMGFQEHVWQYEIIRRASNMNRGVLQQLLQNFSLGSIFYRDYRCNVVHNLTLPLPESALTASEFWECNSIYVLKYKSDPDVYSVEELRRIVFPLKFVFEQTNEALCNLKAQFVEFALEYGMDIESDLDLGAVICGFCQRQNDAANLDFK